MNNLQIFEINLRNYRQYNGENQIDLESTGNENINVIVGQNGAGKSNILNAITLCFYGEEAHTDSQAGDELDTDPCVTKRKLDSLEPGDSIDGYVEIKLGQEEPEYAFRRTFTTVRQSGTTEDGEPRYGNSIGDLTLRQRFGSSDWQPMSQPENVLHQILPTHVYQYFFFDGEQLDEFFNEGYSSRVRDAVHDVSHVELLENGIEHLATVQRKLEKESTNIGGDVAELESRKQSAIDELNRLKERKEDLKEEISKAKEQKEKIREQLAGSEDEQVRDLQERREFLNGRLEEKEEQLTSIKEEVGKSLAQAGGLALNADALLYTADALAERQSEDDHLPGVNTELLNAIVDRGECICGADLSDETTARAHISELLDQLEDDDHQTLGSRPRTLDTLEHAKSLVSELIEDDITHLEETREWISDKEDELRSIQAKLEDVETIDNEKAAELAQKQKEVSNRIEDMNRELGELDSKIQEQEKTVTDRREAWQDAMDEQQKKRHLLAKSVFVQDATDVMKEIKEDILQQVRSETEGRLERYYNDLIWKDETYKVTLTGDYEVRLFDQDGRKNIGSLAAGERQVLALAFMAALSKISGFRAPIVIDTPLGRISSEPKRRIAQNVPDYLEETQITFLMTDVEYSDDVRAFIKQDVANEHLLEYRDGVTEVMAQ